MCTDESSYSTICGPRGRLEHLIRIWPELHTAHRFGMIKRGPVLIDLSRLESPVADVFRDPTSPAVAVLEHSIGFGISLTAQLQAELMVGNHHVPPMPQLLCEPGFRIHGTQQAGPGGHPEFLSGKLDHLVHSVQSVPPELRAELRAPGSRVALLDTGLSSPDSPPRMIDFTNSVRLGVRGPHPAEDHHGHGSAMADVISAVNPAADIHPIRVLDHCNEGKSYEVLAGLQYALYSGEFDCVSASLSSQTGSDCESSLGKSLDWMAAYCRRHTTVRPIQIIAAAGNDPRQKSGYPAKLSGAVVVVLAVDRSGKRADYNSQPPEDATTMEAYGGNRDDPLGNLVHNNGATTPLYGTSLAAAAVTGAILP